MLYSAATTGKRFSAAIQIKSFKLIWLPVAAESLVSGFLVT
jgi:hypothetical protein